MLLGQRRPTPRSCRASSMDHSVRARWSVCGWAFAALLSVGTAHATPRSARLVYVRAANAEQCADEGGLRAAVAARLGYDPFVAYAATTLVVEVRARPGAFEADIHVLEGDGVEAGRRKIASPGADCQKVIDALALSLSIIVDPVAALRGPPQSPPVAPEAPAPADETPAARNPAPARTEVGEVPPADRSDRRPSDRTEARPTPHLVPAFLVAAYGSVAEAPSATAGALVSGRVRLRDFSLGVDVRADLPATHSFGAAGSAKSHSVTGWLVPCAHFGPFAGCALVGAGGFFATGEVAVPVSQSRWILSVGGRGVFDLALGRHWFLQAFLDVVTTPMPPALEVGGRSPYTLPVVGGDIGLGTGWQFP